MTPSKMGLAAIAEYGTPDGDEMLLIRGVESATHSIRRGHAVSAHAYRTYRALIQRVNALEAALNDRERMQGVNDDK